MNKICTSIDQSKKLIELGLDVETSDMHYIEDSTDNPYCELYASKLNEEARKHYNIHYIPAWSLSALLELIPPYLGEFKDGIDFGFSKSMNGKWYSAHYIQYDDSGLVTFAKRVTGDTAVDTAFEMVCMLKENNKI